MDEAIALRPEDALTRFNRGTVYEAVGQYETALTEYDAALATKPDFAKAHLQRGKLLQQQGNHGAAIAAYDAFLSLHPKDTGEVWYSQALCHCQQGDLNAALKGLEQAIQSTPALREQARSEAGFEALRSKNRFQALIQPLPDP